MRRLALLPAVVFLAACGGSSQAGARVRVEFGTVGGNIRPQRLQVTVNGDLANQLRKVTRSGRVVNCAGMSPDFAADYISVGGHTLTVRGYCDPSFTRLWRRLSDLPGGEASQNGGG